MRIINNVVINHSNGANIEYLAGPFEKNLLDIFISTAYLAKGRKNNEFKIDPLWLVGQMGFDILGVSILPDSLIYENSIGLITIKEAIISVIGEEAYNLLPRMTEEEFYELTAPI
jgi:hypothetical protein